MAMGGNSILVLGTELYWDGIRDLERGERKGKERRSSRAWGIVLRFGEGGESDL